MTAPRASGLGLGLEPSDVQRRALESGRALLDQSGVRFIATAGGWSDRLVGRGRTGAVALYENNGALPRIHAVGCTRGSEPMKRWISSRGERRAGQRSWRGRG